MKVTALRELIKAAGGITAVAARIGVREQTIYNWLRRGNLQGVAVEHALRAAEVLDCPLDELIKVERASVRKGA